MDNHVYNCGWSNVDDKFKLWLISDPDVRATAKGFKEAEEALRDVIANTCGTKQASIEFIPPLPKSDFDLKYSASDLVLVSGDEGFDANAPRGRAFESDEHRLKRLTWFDQFYEGGICKDCLSPIGPRTRRPLEISSTGNSCDGGFTDSFGRVMIRLFSSSFLQLLSDREKRRLEFRPIEQTKKTRKKYYELAGPNGPPTAYVSGINMSGCECETCGNRSFSFYAENSAIFNFIADDDLPDPLPEIFTIGRSPEIQLCMSSARWASIVGKKGTGGFTSTPLGVAPATQNERAPEFETLQERERKWHAERREKAEREFRRIDYEES